MAFDNDGRLTRYTRSGNPGLNDRTFSALPRPALADERMTLQGTVNKSFLLLVVLMGCALWPWSQYLSGNTAVVGPSIVIGALAGFVLALIISFKATLAPYLALPYAACEGLAIGGFSAILERKYPGIAIQGVALTFGVLASMLLAYKSGLIRVTQRFRAMVLGATGAVMLLYVVALVARLFFHTSMPFLYNSSGLSLAISLGIIAIAALNLVLDFDLIESGAAQGAPRYMEWYGAFGLMVTLVWLYLEILRFLAKARGR